MKFINKKNIIFSIFIISIILIFFALFMFFNPKKLINMGNIMNENVATKSEAQQKLHSMILRNSNWDSDYNTIINEEKDNIIDSSSNKYITCDYETLFNRKVLPTYLFDNDKLVSILYELDLSQEDLSNIALIHQDFAVNIHSVYENLYRENNKWKTGEERIFDNNMWTNAIKDGKLTLQSIWNSNNEKVFLLTSNKPFFQFLQTEKQRTLPYSITFLVISDEYLKSKSLNDLVKIIPNTTKQAETSK